MKPLIKWIGGKQKLARRIAEHLPSEFTGYHEPFAGAAGLFCELFTAGDLDECGRLTLGDVNADLMSLYAQVQHPRGHEKLSAALWVYEQGYAKKDPEALYYEQRDFWNAGHRDPARFVFLKQTSFNGLWRLNRAGELNASWGKYKKPYFPPEDVIKEWHNALQTVELRPDSFDSLEVQEGDLVYVDPPYHGTFDGYTAGGFTHADHVRLLCKVWKWRQAGAFVMYSNSTAPAVLNLLDITWPEAVRHELLTTYVVNTKGSGRNKVPELLAVG